MSLGAKEFVICQLMGSFMLFNYLAYMKIEVSNGEIIDKITILEIKLERISDPAKSLNIKKELDILLPVASEIINLDHHLVNLLKAANTRLWEIEDDIRELEHKSDFGADFIELARSVYKINDERARIKREINTLTNSGLIEEKSYKGY